MTHFEAPFPVVLDANVLFPFSLRDTLLRLAERGVYQLFWSAQILEEVRRNLVSTGTCHETQAARLIAVMQEAFPESLVEGYEPLVQSMPNQEKDRHVAAAAVKAGAEVIVTNNLRDFRQLPKGLEALSADDFLCDLFDLRIESTIELLKEQAASLRKPARTFNELLLGLEKTVPRFTALVRAELA